MGEVNVRLCLENAWDRYRCTSKEIKESQIRKEEITALVDTGAVMLMLPQDLVESLGLV